MTGDTCDACYGNGTSGDFVSEYWEISQKRLLEQQQQEQVDDDYERKDD